MYNGFEKDVKSGELAPARRRLPSGILGPTRPDTAGNPMDTQRTILARLLERPASLAELSEATGASLPTVRRAVQHLQRARWLRIVGREEGTGGRPAKRFGIDDAVHTVVGVHLAHPGLRLVATDVSGRVLETHAPEGVQDLDPEIVDREVATFVERLRSRHPERRVLGSGVATPGYVDPASGTIITIGRVPNWDNLPLADRLRDATQRRVSVVNDVDALATAEFQPDEVTRPVAYVGFQEGVKFSMVLNGRPYAGPFGNAGLVAPDLLAGTDDGDAARLLSSHGLKELHERLARGPGAEGRASLPARPSVSELFEAAAAERQPAREVTGRMSVVLGKQIAMFVHLLQPNLLVLGGALAQAPPAVRARVEGETRRRLPTLLDNNLQIRPARVVSDDAAAVGATRVLLHRFLAETDAPAPARVA